MVRIHVSTGPSSERTFNSPAKVTPILRMFPLLKFLAPLSQQSSIDDYDPSTLPPGVVDSLESFSRLHYRSIHKKHRLCRVIAFSTGPIVPTLPTQPCVCSTL